MDENLQEIKRVIRRRKALLVITPLLFIGLSFIALYTLEPKYTSSTTILVQKEGSINPALLYQMNIELEEEPTNELEAFESFVTSRSILEKLISELGLESEVEGEINKKAVIETLRGQISVAQGSSDSYELSFEDTDPERAKKAVEFLSNEYIKTKTILDRRRAQESVEFFAARLEEIEQIIEEQRNDIISSTSQNIKSLPVNSQALQSRLQDINTQIETLDWELYQLEGQMSYLNEFLNQNESQFSVSPLYKLPLEDMTYGSELSDLLDEYDEMDDQYTDSYPQLRQLRDRIKQLVERIPGTMESTKARIKNQRQELINQRNRVIDQMEQSYVAEQQSSTKQSSFAVYQDLYNDMKIRLEQAEFTSEISERASGKYTILDPPAMPEEPSSPNRKLVLAAGLLLGIMVGGLMIIIAEILDNTVRTEKDLQLEKPIIAYLSDGRA